MTTLSQFFHYIIEIKNGGNKMKTKKVEKAKGRKVWRQGDVLFFKISQMPKGAEIEANELRIEGEDGHTHLMQDVIIKRNNEQTYVEVSEPTEIKHEEHPALLIPRGTYQVRQNRSYQGRGGD
jgi:hypothetical protein